MPAKTTKIEQRIAGLYHMISWTVNACKFWILTGQASVATPCSDELSPNPSENKLQQNL